MKKKPHPLYPHIEFNDEENLPSEETIEEFVENRKDFYKPYIDRMAFTQKLLEKKKKEKGKEFSDFLNRNYGWVQMNSIVNDIFALMGDSFSFADFRLLFEDAKNEAEYCFLQCENKKETGKYFIDLISNELRAFEMAILDPELEKEKLDLFKYQMQGLKNLKDFLLDTMNSTPAPKIELLDFKGEENTFNKVPLNKVYKYFLQLAEEPEKPFLTSEEVHNFIDKAFCNNAKIDKLTFSNINKNQSTVWKLFHNFYDDCTTNTLYEANRHVKKKYVKLITDNFTNWDYESVHDNFAKGDSKYWKKLKDLK